MLIIIAGIVIGIIIYMIIPYSPVKREYENKVESLLNQYKEPMGEITEEDLGKLPEVLAKYFISNGYLGQKKVSVVRAFFKNVDFSMGIGKKNIRIDYTVNLFVKEPTRIALVNSRMYGIPFQGIDLSKDGKGTMKGIIGKYIKIFDTLEPMIDSAYIAETILDPNLALQRDLKYKEIDKYTIEVTIEKYGQSINGIMYFNENYEFIKFVDEERLCSSTNSREKCTAVVSNYQWVNGVRRPKSLQVIWNFKEGDLVYFNSDNIDISYQ